MDESSFPHTIKSGYPEKEFKFTGEFELIPSSAKRVAARNKEYFSAPIFRNLESGETLVAMQYASRKNK